MQRYRSVWHHGGQLHQWADRYGLSWTKSWASHIYWYQIQFLKVKVLFLARKCNITYVKIISSSPITIAIWSIPIHITSIYYELHIYRSSWPRSKGSIWRPRMNAKLSVKLQIIALTIKRIGMEYEIECWVCRNIWLFHFTHKITEVQFR